MSLGLRGKSALILSLAILVVLALALASGWRALHAIEENLGTAYARNLTRYNKQRILAPVLRELTLSSMLANSEITRRWLLDESNPQKKELFFAEAERYRRVLQDKSYFVGSAVSHRYYFNDARSRFSSAPRYTIEVDDPEEAWFFTTLRSPKDFNINVDSNSKIKSTKFWFNILVKDNNRVLGVVGSGLDFTRFLDQFISHSESGVTPIILNEGGAIQAHPDRKLIDYATVNDKRTEFSTIYRLLPQPADEQNMREALQKAKQNSDNIQQFRGEMDGRRQLFAVSYLPELSWFVVTAVDVNSAQILPQRLWAEPLVIGVALLIFLVTAIVAAVNRLLLSPLLALTRSAREMAKGNYDVKLPPAGSDELGELTRAFGAMAGQVRTHTDELETKIRERTREILQVNEQMAVANKNIGDSIRYASLIQNAILPEREITNALGQEYFVWWRPRDVVGGDLYIFRRDNQGFLIGVIDCAGHGVPGALMTMIAHGTMNVVLDALGACDPAAVLSEVDARLRATLQTSGEAALVATHMEAGLAYVDFNAERVTFAGAKTSLYWIDGHDVGELRGDRAALGGKRQASFHNQSLPLKNQTFYLTTDGVLDQSGGEKGYSFGNQRFVELLRRHARKPFVEQRQAFEQELAAYQSGRPQRDDITVVGFAVQYKAVSMEHRNGSREPVSIT